MSRTARTGRFSPSSWSASGSRSTKASAKPLSRSAGSTPFCCKACSFSQQTAVLNKNEPLVPKQVLSFTSQGTSIEVLCRFSRNSPHVKAKQPRSWTPVVGNTLHLYLQSISTVSSGLRKILFLETVVEQHIEFSTSVITAITRSVRSQHVHRDTTFEMPAYAVNW